MTLTPGTTAPTAAPPAAPIAASVAIEFVRGLLEQAAIVVRASREPALARAFVAFLGRDDARRHLERFGFALPRR